MANTPQAKKRIRRNANRTEINGARVGRIRTYVKAVESALDKGHWRRSGGPFVSQLQKSEHFPRFVICAPPQKGQKSRITAKLTNFRRFSVSSRFIFTFVKKAA